MLVAVVVAVVLVAGEVVVPPRIEEAISERVSRRVPEASSVDADLEGFPVVAGALATGEVEGLVVTLDRVARPEVTIDSVRVEAIGIDVDRGALLTGEVDLEHIDRGRLDAVVTEADLEEELPSAIDLDLSPGRAEASVAGQSVGSDVEASDGVLRFELGALPDLSVPLPGQDFFPCPLDAEVVEGEVHLSCRLDQVPDYLLRQLQEEGG